MGKLPYLTEQEKRRAEILIREIDDMFNSVKVEIFTRRKPYKSYMSEKLEGIITDINCLNGLLE